MCLGHERELVTYACRVGLSFSHGLVAGRHDMSYEPSMQYVSWTLCSGESCIISPKNKRPRDLIWRNQQVETTWASLERNEELTSRESIGQVQREKKSIIHLEGLEKRLGSFIAKFRERKSFVERRNHFFQRNKDKKEESTRSSPQQGNKISFLFKHQEVRIYKFFEFNFRI